jgi:ribosome recycling factor
MSSQPIGDKIHEVHEELVKAAGRHGEDAKDAVRAALAHVDAAKEHLKTQLGDDDAKRKVQAQHDIDRLEEMANTGKKTLDASGEEFRKHLDHLLAEAKSALDGRKT